MLVSYITCMNNKNKYKDEDGVYEPLVQKKQKAGAAVPINRSNREIPL